MLPSSSWSSSPWLLAVTVIGSELERANIFRSLGLVRFRPPPPVGRRDWKGADAHNSFKSPCDSINKSHDCLFLPYSDS